MFFVVQEEACGDFELGLVAGLALGLEGAELSEGFVELAGEAGLVKGEDSQLAGVILDADGGG